VGAALARRRVPSGCFASTRGAGRRAARRAGPNPGKPRRSSLAPLSLPFPAPLRPNAAPLPSPPPPQRPQAYLGRALQHLDEFASAHPGLPPTRLADCLTARHGIDLALLRRRAALVAEGLRECADDEGWRLIQDVPGGLRLLYRHGPQTETTHCFKGGRAKAPAGGGRGGSALGACTPDGRRADRLGRWHLCRDAPGAHLIGPFRPSQTRAHDRRHSLHPPPPFQPCASWTASCQSCCQWPGSLTWWVLRSTRDLDFRSHITVISGFGP
jgi:hypothetical protein